MAWLHKQFLIEAYERADPLGAASRRERRQLGALSRAGWTEERDGLVKSGVQKTVDLDRTLAGAGHVETIARHVRR